MSEEKTLTRKESIDVTKRVLKLINEADKGHTIRLILERIPQFMSEFLGIYLGALVIDGINEGKSLRELLHAAAVICMADFAIWLVSLIILSRKNCHDFSKNNNLTRFLWKKLMNMDYMRLEDSDTHLKHTNALRYIDNNLGFSGLEHSLVYAIGGVIEIIIGIIMIAPIALKSPVTGNGFSYFLQSFWGLLVMLLVVTALEMFRGLYLNKCAMKHIDEVQSDREVLQAHRKIGWYYNFAVFNYRNGKDIRIYGEQELILNEYDECVDKYMQGWRKAFRGNAMYEAGIQTIIVVARLLMYSLIVYRAATGMLTPGEVVAFAAYFGKIQSGISKLSDGIGIAKSAPQFCKMVLDFLDIPDEKYKGTIPTEKRDDDEYEFEFKHVWFKYPNTDKYVLKDINLKWRIGEKMALVGKNGCGKSTLVKLLCRLYDPTEGEITLNGVDIKKYNYEDYLALFSVVFQDSQLFSFSMAENVAASMEYDSERVDMCVRKSGLSERLESMPKDIETCLYKMFDEEGVEISGGEAQKIMLARAIYKGAPFIVLDEPTAALDPISEYDIYTKFNEIVGTKTAIYISHRLSSCRFCDDITVMEEGEIVEKGTHSQLLNKKGVYNTLWTAQAEYYKEKAGELFVG